MNRGSYATLPDRFFARISPTPVAQPRLLKFNQELSAELQLDARDLDSEALAGLFSGNVIAPGLEPIAMAYAGHQFGQFVPQLGDGRAILLGEALDVAGIRRDIQLKGSGRTPFSRGGDGRAALGPVLREYLVSEAMHALGIPTTRALAAVSTGESVFREQGALPGAIVTRVAASFVRVGTFQYFAARDDIEAVRVLADYVIERHYPQLRGSQRPYLELLRAVTDAQASLIANWMNVGFIHGVMNTDNMAVSGETIDFGPCAFLDSYDSAAVFSSIDRHGRYAFGNQPQAGIWNLARLAETLLSLIDEQPERAVDLATEVISTFTATFAAARLGGLRRKLGLSMPEGGDSALADALLEAMQRNQADFSLTFRALCDAAASADADIQLRTLFVNPQEYLDWAVGWRARLAREPGTSPERAAAMRLANPAVIPRNHRIQQVIEAAVEADDFAPFEKLSAALSRPYQPLAGFEAFAEPPQPSERVLQTFCGT
ncbi:MAG: protein adenylyltransferase SelO [Gammaproteobacteria bacterium]